MELFQFFQLNIYPRALVICLNERLQDELKKIHSVLTSNSYPDQVIQTTETKMKEFDAAVKYGSAKCPVYLRLQRLGPVSMRFESQVKSAIDDCYSTVEPRVVCIYNKRIASCYKKDVLPAPHQNNVVYQFSCHCDSTSQRLQDRITQHIPNRSGKGNTVKTEHLFLVPAKQLLKQHLVILPLDSTFLKTQLVLATTVMTCLPF